MCSYKSIVAKIESSSGSSLHSVLLALLTVVEIPLKLVIDRLFNTWTLIVQMLVEPKSESGEVNGCCCWTVGVAEDCWPATFSGREGGTVSLETITRQAATCCSSVGFSYIRKSLVTSMRLDYLLRDTHTKHLSGSSGLQTMISPPTNVSLFANRWKHGH